MNKAETKGQEMTTRERIEAEIVRLESLLADYGPSTVAHQANNDVIRHAAGVLLLRDATTSAAFLRSILADLPDETPLTLAEARESGALFLGMGFDSAVYLCRYREDMRGKLYDVGNDTEIFTDQPFSAVKRLCDWQWSKAEEER